MSDPDPRAAQEQAALDEQLEETFPASDTPAALRRGPSDPADPPKPA